MYIIYILYINHIQSWVVPITLFYPTSHITHYIQFILPRQDRLEDRYERRDERYERYERRDGRMYARGAADDGYWQGSELWTNGASGALFQKP